MTFVAMDKGLRIATGGEGHDHSRNTVAAGRLIADQRSSRDASADGESLKQWPESHQRNGRKVRPRQTPYACITQRQALALTSIIADFTHNITDGLAMSASFYTSPTIGATTTMAVFFHEIPHEVGDYALLIPIRVFQRAAMGAQFITALSALLGTIIGIAVQEYGGSGANTAGPELDRDGPAVG